MSAPYSRQNTFPMPITPPRFAALYRPELPITNYTRGIDFQEQMRRHQAEARFSALILIVCLLTIVAFYSMIAVTLLLG